MKLRIAFLSTLFLFLAGAAMATPTVGEAPDAALTTVWDLGQVAPPAHGYALASQAPVQESTELAVFGPCGCTPMPGCPFPIPWPSPGPTFPLPGPFPAPSPDPCTCPWPF